MTDPAVKDEVRWNGGAMVVFILASVALLCMLEYRDALARIGTLSILDLIVLGLATFRAVHLLTFDKIFDFVRESFMDKVNGEYVKPTRGFRHMLSELLECLWCTGMWSAVIILTLYLLSPAGKFIVWTLAIAGIGSMLQIASKRVAD